MFRTFLAVVAIALTAATAVAPAEAQRGDRGGDRGDHRGDRGDRGGRGGGDWDRGNRGGRGGGDWDRGNRGRDHDRGRRDHDRWNNTWSWGYSGWGYGGRHYYRDNDLWLGLGVGSALLGYALTPEPYYGGGSYAYGGYPAQAPNAWGLRPNQCRWDREFGYWYNRPADVEVQRCADGYGSVYVVQGSHRFLQYR